MIGIALVVEDASHGVRLAFRYPASLHVGNNSTRATDILKKDEESMNNNPYAYSDDEDFDGLGPNRGSIAFDGEDFQAGFFDLEPKFFAQLFRPKNILCNKSFELEVDQVMFISHPVLCRNSSLNLFNVIFAVPSDIGETTATEHGALTKTTLIQNSREHLVGYRLAAAKLAHALYYEECRCNYVSTEASKILNVWEQLIIDGKGVEGESASGGVSDPQTLIDVCLARSLLACELKDIYHKLNASGSAHFPLNLFVPMSLALRDPTSHPVIPIRPYQTLMLLDEEADVLASLPDDASPQIRSFVEMANVMKSFLELHVESGISLTQLFRLAAHLVYWQKGKVIDTLTKNNVYVVHPEADLRDNSRHALEFSHKFGLMTLHEALNRISSRLTNIGEHMRGMNSESQLQFIHILIWLLRRNFLVRIHTYIHLIIDRSRKHAGSTRRHSRKSRASVDFRDELQAVSSSPGTSGGWLVDNPNIAGEQQPELLKPDEKAYLEQIANDTPVYQLFKRLCPYFHGKHHVEEIMWRETVSRKAIMSVLANYGDVLVTVQLWKDENSKLRQIKV